MPEVLAIILAISTFAAAYIFYLIVLFFFRKVTSKDGAWARVVHELRYPFLFILLELAAIFSLQILQLPAELTYVSERIVNLLIIATFGWFFIGLVRALHRNYLHRIGEGFPKDVAGRSSLTQILFLYHFSVFAIIAITIAAILLTFPYIKSVGVGILGSAGIAGIALGIAARPILLNLIAGFQIAVTKTVKIGDAITIEGEFARVETIHLTHVIVRTWDWRRIVLPISYFIDKPFQNWDINNPELLTTVLLYLDYTAPIEAVRTKAKELAETHLCWNKRTCSVQVAECTENTIKVKVFASVNDASAASELQAFLREELINFLQTEYPHALPMTRNLQVTKDS